MPPKITATKSEIGHEVVEHVVTHTVGHVVGEALGKAAGIAPHLVGIFFTAVTHVGTLNPDEGSAEQIKRTEEYLKREYGTDADGNPNRPWRTSSTPK